MVLVDKFSGWFEASPVKEDASSVIKIFMKDWIARHGFPQQIPSDNGSHLQKVEKACGITHKFGTIYHPQLQGKEERANRLLKKNSAKIMATTKMNSVEAFSIALTECRTTHRETGLSPDQLLTGRDYLGTAATSTPNMIPGLPTGGVTLPKALTKSLSVS